MRADRRDSYDEKIQLRIIKDACRDSLKIYDDDENEYELRDIAIFIKQFCGKHKSDSNSDKNFGGGIEYHL